MIHGARAVAQLVPLALALILMSPRLALVGTLALVLVVLAAMNFNSLPLVGNRGVISVEFAEAGTWEPVERGSSAGKRL